MFHKSVLMANWTISYHLLPRAMEITVNKIHFFMISPHLMEIFWSFICLNMYVILYIEHSRSTANNASHLSFDPVYSVNLGPGWDDDRAKLYLSQIE